MKYDAEVSAAVGHWAPALGVSIPPSLVHAVIQNESTHGLHLVTAEPGNRFSYGPMMVLDSTATKYGVADPSVLQDPALGIWYGVRNLGEQLKTFKGDIPAAVSAYNTGPSRAKRNKAGKFPNQPYVDKVLGWWAVYRGALAGIGGALLLGGALYFALRARRSRRRAA